MIKEHILSRRRYSVAAVMSTGNISYHAIKTRPLKSFRTLCREFPIGSVHKVGKPLNKKDIGNAVLVLNYQFCAGCAKKLGL